MPQLIIYPDSNHGPRTTSTRNSSLNTRTLFLNA